MMYHGLSPRVWAASTYSRVLMSHCQAAHDAENAGAGGERDGDEDVECAGAHPHEAERIGVEDEGGEEPRARDDRHGKTDCQLARLGAVARDKEHREERDRNSKKYAGKRIGDWRLENAWRDQQVE